MNDGDHAEPWLPISRKEMKPTMSPEFTTTSFARAGTLGVVAGLRSQLPLALLTIAANRGAFPAAPAPLSFLRSRGALITLGLAAGELVGDKLPAAPPRTDPASLAFRVAIGATVGGAVGREAGTSVAACALLGAMSATVSSFAGATYRRAAQEATDVPDIVFAVLEDAAAIGLGVFALHTIAISPTR